MDRLTGAADTGELMAMLDERDGAVHGEPVTHYGLIVVGVVGLRVINSEFGWPLGDAVLRSLATRLGASTTSACVARVDSDKFAVLIDDVDREDVREIGARLKRLLNAAPFEVDGVSLPVRVRTTFAIGPAPADTPEKNVLWAALRFSRMKQIHDLKERIVDMESQVRLRQAQVEVGAFREQLATAIAYRDELTRAFNRDGYDALLPDVETPYSLAFFDVDKLRDLNKMPGLLWKAGDMSLVKVALFLKDLSSDVVVVRWGGDEFLVLFPNLSPADVKRIVEAAALQCKDELMVEDTPVTLSGGVSYVADAGQYDEAFRLAQEATELAKRSGRSQTIVAAQS